MKTDTENADRRVSTVSSVNGQGGEIGIDSCSDLEGVRAQFEQWRLRSGRRHIPDDLWVAAIGLLDYYPVSVVSEHLRLNSARLQQQEQRLSSQPPAAARTPPALTGRSARCPVTRSKSKRTEAMGNSQPALEFLELTPQGQISPFRTPQAACSIIMERSDGSRLTLRLPPDARMIESLCASFLKQ